MTCLVRVRWRADGRQGACERGGWGKAGRVDMLICSFVFQRCVWGGEGEEGVREREGLARGEGVVGSDRWEGLMFLFRGNVGGLQ